MASASIEDAPVSAHAANLVTAMKILAASAATTALVPPSALTVAILPDRDCQGAIRRRPPWLRSVVARQRQLRLTSAAQKPAAGRTEPASPSVAEPTTADSRIRRTALPARRPGAGGGYARSTPPRRDLRSDPRGAQTPSPRALLCGRWRRTTCSAGRSRHAQGPSPPPAGRGTRRGLSRAASAPSVRPRGGPAPAFVRAVPGPVRRPDIRSRFGRCRARAVVAPETGPPTPGAPRLHGPGARPGPVRDTALRRSVHRRTQSAR